MLNNDTDSIQDLSERKSMDEKDVELRERISILELSNKLILERLEKLEGIVENQRDMLAEMKSMREDLNEVKSSVKEIKEKPVKRYDHIISCILSGIGGGIGGAILAVLMGGS